MDEQLKKRIDAMGPELIALIQRWVSVPSVKGAPEPGAPFGAANRQALQMALDDAKAMGFRVRNIDGYAGDAEMGQGEETLGILCHLDVVPAGDGWETDPFTAVVKGDRIYGRGTSDDKGPAVAALLAMKAVQEANIPLKKRVRLILGCDEETGSADMRYYQDHADMPEMGFSPDACYPVINIEKGAYQLRLTAPASSDGVKVLSFNVGERPNVVPGLAKATVQGDAALAAAVNAFAKNEGLEVTASSADNVVTIVSTGVTGHAAFPETARNAIGQLLLCLEAIGVKGPLHTLAKTVGMTYYGEGLGCAFEDDLSGKLTLNLGIIRADEKEVSCVFDIRYAITADPEWIVNSIREAVKPGGFSVIVDSHTPVHHVPEESPLVQALLDAYHEETGLKRETIAIGGGTYAKCLKQGVAFGAAFPDEEEVAHQAGEYVSISSLIKSIHIFANAIIRIAGR